MFVAAVPLAAQPLDRLSGRVVTTRGTAATAAEVRIEAVFGFAGGNFPGQRTFSARANENGEWALLAFKAGIWWRATSPGTRTNAAFCPRRSAK